MNCSCDLTWLRRRPSVSLTSSRSTTIQYVKAHISKLEHGSKEHQILRFRHFHVHIDTNQSDLRPGIRMALTIRSFPGLAVITMLASSQHSISMFWDSEMFAWLKFVALSFWNSNNMPYKGNGKRWNALKLTIWISCRYFAFFSAAMLTRFSSFHLPYDKWSIL